MTTSTKRIMKLFQGMDRAYGTYDLTEIVMEGDKKKGKAKTIQEPVTEFLWQEHLNGNNGLGIIPINDDSQCHWGCIDIDQYDLDHTALLKQIHKMSFPLIDCKSKSGGAHLMLFMKEPVAADIIQSKLKFMASKLGFSNAEVFPKQTRVLSERGDLGSWLNMPYFDMGKENRFAVGLSKSNEVVKFSLEQFLDLAEITALLPKDLGKIQVENTDARFKDIPPCMQCLLEQGFPEGTRNVSMYNFGILAKRMHPEGWEEVLEDWNREFCDPPLPAGEMYQIQRSLSNKDYRYRCNEQPLAGYCNSGVCRTRKFGIDSNTSMPQLSSLTKLESDPPMWFLNAEGGRLELTTEELQDQKKFQRKCMEYLNVMPPRVKDNQWHQIISGLMENMMILEQPDDVGTKGHFLSLLEEFTTRSIGKTREEILLNKPWGDIEGSKVYFQLKDLMRFLDRNKFREYSQGQVTTRLKELGGNSEQKKIKGYKRNLWWIPMFEQQTEPFDIPNFDNSPF